MSCHLTSVGYTGHYFRNFNPDVTSRAGSLEAIHRLPELERVKGLEPSSSAWKAEVLPLNYTRVAELPVELLIQHIVT